MIVQKFYNPHDLLSSVVVNIATGREKIKSRILAAIESNRSSPQIQHILVSGPRGFGKSFLLRLLQIEVESRYSDIAFVLLPEEQPNIDEPDALVREIGRIWRNEKIDVVQPRWYEADHHAWEKSVAELDRKLDEQFGKNKGLLIAAVENIDLLLDRVFKDDVALSQLREWLTRKNSRIMLLAATSSGIVDGSYDARLFQAFESIKLEPWDENECLEFFNKQRQMIGKGELDRKGTTKALAISSFIGGTPRLAAILGDALFENDSIRSAEVLDKLVDELTPYYKHRMEILNPRSRKLLDALLRGGEPCSQTKLAERVGATSQGAIAAPFKILLDEQILAGRRTKNSREVLYSLQDRVFAHYYRTRYLTHGQQPSPLEAIVDFLETFFSMDEKRIEASRLIDLGRPREARLLADMAAREDIDATPRTTILTRAMRRLKDDARLLKAMNHPSLLELLNALEAGKYELVATRAQNISRSFNDPAVSTLSLAVAGWAKYGLRLDSAGLKDFENAVVKSQALGSADELVIALRERGIYRSIAMRDRAGSIEDCFGAHKLRDQVTSNGLKVVALICGSRGYSQTRQAHEALGTAHEAATIASRLGDDAQHARCERELAFLLTHDRRYEEGHAKALEAAGLAAKAKDISEQAECLRLAAENLQRLKRYNEAIVVARQAIGLAKAVGDLGEQANSLGTVAQSLGRDGRYREAIEVAKEAANIAASAGDPFDQAKFLRIAAWDYGYAKFHAAQVNTAQEARKISADCGDLYGESKALRIVAFGLIRLGRFADSFAAAEKAAAISSDIGMGVGQSENLLLSAWILGHHKRYEDAILKARDAAQIADREKDYALGAQCWNSAAFYLGKLHRHVDALEAAKKAAKLAAEAGDIFEQADCLLLVIWNLRQLKRFPDALVVARQTAALANSSKNVKIEAHALRDVVRTASFLGDVDSVMDGIKRWRVIETESAGTRLGPSAKNCLHHVLTVGIKSLRTKPVVEFLASNRQWVEYVLADWQIRELGYSIRDLLDEKGRVEAFGAVADLMNNIAPEVAKELASSESRILRTLFYRIATATINGIAVSIKDTTFLRNVVDLIQESLGSKFGPLAHVLRAAIQFHDSNGSIDVLDRVDPDIATAIRRTYSNVESGRREELPTVDYAAQ